MLHGQYSLRRLYGLRPTTSRSPCGNARAKAGGGGGVAPRRLLGRPCRPALAVPGTPRMQGQQVAAGSWPADQRPRARRPLLPLGRRRRPTALAAAGCGLLLPALAVDVACGTVGTGPWTGCGRHAAHTLPTGCTHYAHRQPVRTPRLPRSEKHRAPSRINPKARKQPAAWMRRNRPAAQRTGRSHGRRRAGAVCLLEWPRLRS